MEKIERHVSVTMMAEYLAGECPPDLEAELEAHFRTCTEPWCGGLVQKVLQEDRGRRQKRETELTLAELGISFVPKSS